MFNQVQTVLKNKDKAEKRRKQFRQDELQMLKTAAAFKAQLLDDLKAVDLLLDGTDVDSVIIQVDPSKIAAFSSAIYTEDLAEYNIEQSDESDIFKMSRKTISF